MKSKTSKTVAAITIISLFILIVVVLLGLQTTPNRLKCNLPLNIARNCIWYGYDKNAAFTEKDVEKRQTDEIQLHFSLLEYLPLADLPIKELDRQDEGSNLFYNPDGINDQTWIIIIKCNILGDLIRKNWILWHNGDISQSYILDKKILDVKSIRYYKYDIN